MFFLQQKNAEKALQTAFSIRHFCHQFSGNFPGSEGPSNDHSFTEPSLEAVAMADELAVMKPQRLTVSVFQGGKFLRRRPICQ